MTESKNVGKRVATAVEAVVKKMEDATETVVEGIYKKGEETIEKLHRAGQAVVAPFADADKFLDELIGGHNGGPALDDAKFPADFREAAGQPSALGTSTPVPLPEHVKKPE